MAPIFRLTSTAPGQARIDIKGVAIPAKDKGLEIAFQRASDDEYIGSDGSWQSEPRWHRLERIPGPSTTVFLAGPDVVDALAEVYYADSFRASARWKDGQGEGALRIAGELIGSAGLKQEPPSEKEDPEPKPPKPPIPPKPPPPPDFCKRRPLLCGLVIGVLLLLIAGALWLGSTPSGPEQETARQENTGVSQQAGIDRAGTADKSQTASDSRAAGGQSQPQRGEPPETIPGAGPTQPSEVTAAPKTSADGEADLALEPETQPDQPKDSAREPHTQSQSGPASSAPRPGVEARSGVETAPAATAYDAPQLRGREYVSWLVDQSPDATTYRAQAERRAEQGDCPAVILLYDRAARSSPEIAAQVARLYDPVGFRPSPCIDQPSPSNAREYYELAAEGAVPDVRQRLDEILSRGQESLPVNRTWENRR